MSTKTDARYPRQAIAEAIAQALPDKYDFTTGTAWIRPPGCPACRAGEECDLAAGLTVRTPDGCRGYIDTDARLPEDESVTAQELVRALPEPDSDSNVSARETGNILGQMLTIRLRNQAYRRQQAFTLLGDAFDALEQSVDPDSKTQADSGAPGYRPLCMYCSAPIPPERGPRAKFCKSSHRVALAKRKRAARITAGAEQVLPVSLRGGVAGAAGPRWPGTRDRPPDQRAAAGQDAWLPGYLFAAGI